MSRSKVVRYAVLSFAFLLSFAITAPSSAVERVVNRPADWPQFRGPHGDAICSETGLLTAWPEGGPKLLWGYNRVANGTANIPSAVVRGNDVFVTTAYKTGCAALKVTRNGDSFNAEEVYFLDHNTFENHHGGVVLVGDHIYGGHGGNKGTPVCLELASGQVAWKAEAPGEKSAAVVYADGHLYFRYQNGPVALIEATPEAFRVKGTFVPVFTKGNNWAHPVIHDGKLYLRQSNVLMCYDIRGQ